MVSVDQTSKVGHGRLRVARHHHDGGLDAVSEAEAELTPVGEVFIAAEERPVVTKHLATLCRVVLIAQAHRSTHHRLQT